MRNSNEKNSAKTGLVHLEKRARSRYTRLRDTHDSTKQDTGFLIQHKAENDQDMPLRYHFSCIAQHIWKIFNNLPLLLRNILTIFTIWSVYPVLVMIIHLIVPLLNSAYTILGIIVSAIALYEFSTKRRKKKN